MPDRSAGESTYLPQVLESLHDTIKDALPRNIRNVQPSTAIRKLSAALEAVPKSRNWIQVASGKKVADKWEHTDLFEHEIAPQKYVAGNFSPRYVGGPRLLTEHLPTEDDYQWAKLTLDCLTEHMPHHFKNMEVGIEGFKELYVVPLFTASLAITDEMLAATKTSLFLHYKDAYAAAKEHGDHAHREL